MPDRTLSAELPKKALRTTLVLSSVAVAATGTAVAGGVFSTSGAAAGRSGADSATASLAGSGPSKTSAGSADDTAASVANPRAATGPEIAAEAEIEASTTRRTTTLSRSDRREAADPVKEASLSQATGRAMSQTEDLSNDDPRTVGRALLAEFGWSSDQFGCLDSLWTKESGWNIYADNPSSSAYGIPQALPGSKMSSAGADWATNPVTQITWGLGYIRDRYGSPCGAWSHSVSNGWY